MAENPGGSKSAVARMRKSAFMDFILLSFGENISAVNGYLEHVVADFSGTRLAAESALVYCFRLSQLPIEARWMPGGAPVLFGETRVTGKT